VPDADGADLLDHCFEDLVGDRSVQQQSARRTARLPGRRGVVHPEHRALDGLVEVRVGQHDEGVLAAQFEAHILHPVLGGLALD